jgi:hypothetical protein
MRKFQFYYHYLGKGYVTILIDYIQPLSFLTKKKVEKLLYPNLLVDIDRARASL